MSLKFLLYFFSVFLNKLVLEVDYFFILFLYKIGFLSGIKILIVLFKL